MNGWIVWGALGWLAAVGAYLMALHFLREWSSFVDWTRGVLAEWGDDVDAMTPVAFAAFDAACSIYVRMASGYEPTPAERSLLDACTKFGAEFKANEVAGAASPAVPVKAAFSPPPGLSRRERQD